MHDLSGLSHTTRTSASGAEIIVLDTGAVITAEDEAMLQALHSRSVKGVKGHLEALAKRGSGNFMSQYYVGYGDKSIGDCGTTTIFIEGVSMLCAKAIQDWALYSGQEASTRYIDFATQPFLNPYGIDAGSKILECWREFYVRNLPIIIADLKVRFPRSDGENETVYEKAIKARAFDVARGFLPAGAKTNLSWHTNLRQAADHLLTLRNHPLSEVRDVADAIEEALMEKYPNSFTKKRYEGTESFYREWMASNYYFRRDHGDSTYDFTGSTFNFDYSGLHRYREILSTRPRKTEVPQELGNLGQICFEFFLDFASFRDIQRHRAVYQRMPLLTLLHGFESWYLEELPESIRAEATTLIAQQASEISNLDKQTTADVHRDQYYMPMGSRVHCVVSGDLPAIVWLIELRATHFVHPTLRRRAQQMAKFLQTEFGEGLTLHLDPDPDRFDVKRGTQDIVMR